MLVVFNLDKRVSIKFEDCTTKVIDDWRKQQDTIPSFNEAVNVMLKRYGALLELEKLKNAIPKKAIQ